jgi:hypothetical protein
MSDLTERLKEYAALLKLDCDTRPNTVDLRNAQAKFARDVSLLSEKLDHILPERKP